MGLEIGNFYQYSKSGLLLPRYQANPAREMINFTEYFEEQKRKAAEVEKQKQSSVKLPKVRENKKTGKFTVTFNGETKTFNTKEEAIAYRNSRYEALTGKKVKSPVKNPKPQSYFEWLNEKIGKNGGTSNGESNVGWIQDRINQNPPIANRKPYTTPYMEVMNSIQKQNTDISAGHFRPTGERLIPSVDPKPLNYDRELFDAIWNEDIAPKVEQDLQKRPLWENFKPSNRRLLPEVEVKPLTQKEMLDAIIEEHPPVVEQNPAQKLAKGIGLNHDVRGMNLVGDELQKAQNILNSKANFAPYREGYGEILDNSQTKTEAQKMIEELKKPKPEFEHIYPHEDANVYSEMLEQAKNNEKAVKGASKWAKYGKWGAAIAGVAALAAGGYALFKSCDNDNTSVNAENPLDKQPVVNKDNKPEEAKPEVTDKPIAPAPTDAKPEEIKPEEPAYVPLLQLEEDGTYTTIKNDNFWKIAERHLKDKFKKEGIDRNPTNAEIQKETDRIMEANKYDYDNKHWFPNPMLQPNVKLIIEEKLDKAA